MNNEWRDSISRRENIRSMFRICAAMLSLLGTVGVAAEPGGYLGARIGVSDDAPGIEGSGRAGELFGGYRINDHWAVELGFLRLTDDYPPVEAAGVVADGNGIRLGGAALSARYDWAMGERFQAHARVGAANLDIRTQSSLIGLSLEDPTPVIYRWKHHGNVMASVLALGVEARLSNHWQLGVELQHYRGDLRLGLDEDSPYLVYEFNRPGSAQIAMLTATANF